MTTTTSIDTADGRVKEAFAPFGHRYATETDVPAQGESGPVRPERERSVLRATPEGTKRIRITQLVVLC
jgi:hypothetical protein